MVWGASIFVTQQLFAVALGYAIVERLIVGQRLGRIKNMDRASHVVVQQTNELEVACHRKDNCQLLTFEEKRASDAAGAVEGRGTGGESRTTDGKGWPYLIAGQEGNSVRFVGF